MPENKRDRTRTKRPAKTDTRQDTTASIDTAIEPMDDVVAEEITVMSDRETDEIADASGLETGTQSAGLPDDGPADPLPGAELTETPAQTGAPVASAAAFPESSPGPKAQDRPAPAGGTGIAGMIIGGVLAAAIGSAATLTFLPEGWRATDTSGLERRITAVESAAGGGASAELDARIGAALEPLAARLAALESLSGMTETLGSRVTALEAVAPVDLAPILARIATLEATELDAQALSAALAPLSTRIAQIEADIAAQARAAVETALAEARADVDAQARALSAREDDIESAQARIAARAALAELVAAAESGAAVPGALETLRGSVEVPDALAPLADGLITLGALQDAFAPAARAALTAESPAPDAPIADRVLSFLRNQTGARSLAPRDGDDADAVLSRAEAALRQGDVAATLSELDTLTGDAVAAMAAWRALAEARQAALAALDALQDQLSRNEG